MGRVTTDGLVLFLTGWRRLSRALARPALPRAPPWPTGRWHWQEPATCFAVRRRCQWGSGRCPPPLGIGQAGDTSRTSGECTAEVGCRVKSYDRTHLVVMCRSGVSTIRHPGLTNWASTAPAMRAAGLPAESRTTTPVSALSATSPVSGSRSPECIPVSVRSQRTRPDRSSRRETVWAPSSVLPVNSWVSRALGLAEHWPMFFAGSLCGAVPASALRKVSLLP
ncbi:hypothetical protein OK006_8839 [Actinobacteria bacterium OK006]|nr:hypothetical protein OK006_8839 [Actinobacteria bacterium OK006]